MRARLNSLVAGGLVVAAIFAGCGSTSDAADGPHSFPEAPYAVIVSEKKHLTIEVRTGPTQPPARGHAEVELLVLDEQGAPVDGLQLGVTPWMPAMGHGTSVTPIVQGAGDGKYVVRDVVMYMAGRWELRTTFSGGVTDSATPVFDVL